MPKKNKPHIVIWVSDVHAGSRWAVCPPEITIDLGGEEELSMFCRESLSI